MRNDWRDFASCIGMATRYYDPWDTPDDMFEPLPEAKRICDQCIVRVECLAEALRTNDECVRGGLTKKQRDAILRPRRRKTCPICSGRQFVDIAGANAQVCVNCGQAWATTRELMSISSPGVIDREETVVASGNGGKAPQLSPEDHRRTLTA